MEGRTRLSAEERRALSAAPPKDDQGRSVPWRLEGRDIEDDEFKEQVEHEGLEVVDCAFRGFAWSGEPTLRDCVFREVSFERVRFVGARLENVTFERCKFDEVRFDGCALSGCRFVGGEAALISTRRTVLRGVELEGLSGDSWTLRAGELRDCTLRDCTFVAPRISNCTIDGLVVEGGSLQGAELTLCEIGGMRLAGATVKRLRVVGGAARSIGVVEVEGDDLSFADVQIDALRLERCVELVNPKVLDCRVGALVIDRCANVLGLVVQGCELDRLTITRSSLQYTTLAAVRAAGPLQVDDSAFVGLVFRDGAWQDASFAGTRIDAYLAFDGARFTSLRRQGVVEGAGVQYQLDGSPVADGATLWGALHGA